MLKTKLAFIVRLAPSLALLSCAAPKAIVVEEAPVPKTDKPQQTAALPDPAVPATPDDGIRLPDMLGLPDEGEFRNAGPATPSSPGSGAVIARPPAEPPPPPPKPKP